MSKGLNNNNSFVNYFFNHCLFERSSIMYKNITKISSDVGLPMEHLTKIGKFKLKKLFSINHNWKSEFLKELMQCRDGKLFSNLNKDEIYSIIYSSWVF